MSESVLHVVLENGDIVTRHEFGNGHGYALPVWSYLAEKYVRKEGESDSAFFGRWYIDSQCKDVWALKKDPRLERFERIVLLASFDRVIVKSGDFKELCDAFRKFENLYKEKYPNNVCHYQSMAYWIEKQTAEIIGACFTATTVGENIWEVYDECECPTCGDSHRKEESRPYNINKDQGHWFLFESIEKLQGK